MVADKIEELAFPEDKNRELGRAFAFKYVKPIYTED
jgi:hypothetical protein